jgi:multidrug resistance efflux pump
VQIIEADLQRARVLAFDDPGERAQVTLLENRLEQERTRLRMAQHRADQLEIRAPVAGTLMFADPHEWRGRPVQVGESLMMIIDPARTKLRVWLPEHDNIRFDWASSVTVILDSDPGFRRTAALRYVANHSQPNRDGLPCFRAEADWVESDTSVKVGLQGTAVLYGDRVPLGYWLSRRPLATLRRFVGM